MCSGKFGSGRLGSGGLGERKIGGKGKSKILRSGILGSKGE